MDSPKAAASSNSGILEFGTHQFYVAERRMVVLVLRGEVSPEQMQELAETIDEVNPLARHLAVVCDATDMQPSRRARHAIAQLRFSGESRAGTLVVIAGANGATRVALATGLDLASDASEGELQVRFVPDRRSAMDAARAYLAEYAES